MICPKLTLSIAVCLNWSISSQDELDWGEAGVLRSEIHQNKIHHIHAARFSNTLQYSMKRLCACAYFNFEMGLKSQKHWINFQDQAEPQSSSSCMEINQLVETAAGNVKLGVN